MTRTIDDIMDGGYDQIKWPENNTIKFRYLGQEVVETRHGDRVKLAVYDLTDKRETSIYTVSKRMLVPLFRELKAEIGDEIAIRRSGSGFDTQYEVKITARADDPKRAKQPVQDVHAEEEVFPTPQAAHPF